jgi:hypothetical protein
VSLLFALGLFQRGELAFGEDDACQSALRIDPLIGA